MWSTRRSPLSRGSTSITRSSARPRRPLIVLDGAHNPAAARALTEAMAVSFQWTKLWLIVSVMEDKDIAGVLGPLVGLADDVIVTRNDSPRAASVERLADDVRALGKEP